MKEFITKFGFKAIGITLGAIAGGAYYYYIGCASGTCPITSNPYISVGYGALLGYLLGGMIKINKHEKN